MLQRCFTNRWTSKESREQKAATIRDFWQNAPAWSPEISSASSRSKDPPSSWPLKSLAASDWPRFDRALSSVVSCRDTASKGLKSIEISIRTRMTGRPFAHDILGQKAKDSETASTSKDLLAPTAVVSRCSISISPLACKLSLDPSQIEPGP